MVAPESNSNGTGLWDWLRREGNQRTLRMIGAGVATVAAGAFALMQFVDDDSGGQPSSTSQSLTVSASNRGQIVQAAGDITITYGIREFEETQRALLERIEGQLAQSASLSEQQAEKLKAAQAEALAKLDNLDSAFEEQRSDLKQAIGTLAILEKRFDPRQVEEAKKALAKGDVQAAEALLKRSSRNAASRDEQLAAVQALKILAETGGQLDKADALSAQAAALTRLSEDLFVDDFEQGQTPNTVRWQVLNPRPEEPYLEKGKLILISSTVGSLSKEDIHNMVLGREPLPDIDWVMTARLRIEFQTVQERFMVGVYADSSHYVVLALDSHAYSDLYATLYKQRGDQQTSRNQQIWNGGGNSATVLRNEMPQPLLLRISKRASEFVAEVMLEGHASPQWQEVGRFNFRGFTGSPFFALKQRKENAGETAVRIDWIRVAPLADTGF